MGLWREELLPRVIDLTLGTPSVGEWRSRCLQGARGVLVEPGFGSGLNLPHLPPEVTQVYAIDPAVVGRRLAAKRIDAASATVVYDGLDGQKLPLEDSTCDGGVLTFTLCTIPDHAAALGELRRVIKPGGTLHFVEHAAAPDRRVRAVQDFFTPVQRLVADGCHLNRPIVELIEQAGFEIEWSEARYVGRPKSGSFFVAGVARNPG